MKCPNCKMDNPAGSDFCLTCGTNLPCASPAESSPLPDSAPADSTGKRKCPNCSASNPADATFCSLCGNDLQPVETGTPPPATPALQPESDPEIQLEPDEAEPSPPVSGAGGASLPSAEQLMHQAVEQKLSIKETLELATAELADDHRENAARILLEGMRNHPSDLRMRKLFRENFDDKELRGLNLPVAPVPIWSELDRTLLYPLQNGEWAAILIGGVVLGILQYIAAFAFFYGFIISVTVAAYAANVLVRHLKWASVGRPGHPGIIEFHFGDLLYVTGSVVATMWPPLALLIFLIKRMVTTMDIEPRGVILTLVMIGITYIIGSFLLPMSLLVASLFNRWTMAFDYSFILRTARLIWKDYIFAWILLIALAVVQIVFTAITRATPGGAFIPTPILKWIVELYNLALLGHILGRIYYYNEQRLGWFDETSTQPQTSPLGLLVMILGLVGIFGLSHLLLQPGPKSRARDKCRAAFAAVNAGKPDDALKLADAAMKIVPVYAGAHMAKAKAYLAKKQYKKALKQASAAIKLAPDYPAALQLRQAIKTQMKNRSGAQEDGWALQRKMETFNPRAMNMYFMPPDMVFEQQKKSTDAKPKPRKKRNSHLRR